VVELNIEIEQIYWFWLSHDMDNHLKELYIYLLWKSQNTVSCLYYHQYCH